MIKKKVIDQFRVAPGKKVNLKDFDTGWAATLELKEAGKDAVKEKAAEMLEENREELAKAQELLWASDIHSVLVVLQAMDAAGKDDIIKHVMSGLNPQGCQVFSFK
jgi:polyphosphate kinase 2 (PPK2 family)